MPPYTPHIELSIFAELFHRIPITAIKHTDFGIDSILINVRNYTVNGIISLHKFFLLKRFFSMSLRIIGYSIHYTKYHSCNQWFSVSILVYQIGKKMSISDKLCYPMQHLIIIRGVGFHLKILSTYYIIPYSLKNRKKSGIPDFHIQYAL